MSLGPIPFRAVRAYADEYGLRGREREVLFQVIRAVDNHWLGQQAKRAKREAEKTRSSSSGGRPGTVVDTW